MTTNLLAVSIGKGVPRPIFAIVYAPETPRRLIAQNRITDNVFCIGNENCGMPSFASICAIKNGKTNKIKVQTTTICAKVFVRSQPVFASVERRNINAVNAGESPTAKFPLRIIAGNINVTPSQPESLKSANARQ